MKRYLVLEICASSNLKPNIPRDLTKSYSNSTSSLQLLLQKSLFINETIVQRLALSLFTMDPEERERWVEHFKRVFSVIGGIQEAWTWKSDINDLTPTPFSVTPTGMLSPGASEHGENSPRPRPHRPVLENVGYPTAAELIKRLEGVEREQERKQRKQRNKTRLSPGTYDRLHDYDVDCTMSDLSSKGSQGSSSSNTPACLSPHSSELTEDQRSFLESLLIETQSNLCQDSLDTPIKMEMGTSRRHLDLSSKGCGDGSSSTTPATPGSPVSEPTQAQRAFLEGLLNKPQLHSLKNSSNTSTNKIVKTLKRESDSSPSSQPKKPKTCAYKGTESSTAPLGEASYDLASTSALETPQSNPIGTLARNAGQEVRRRSNEFRNKPKRTVNSRTLRSKISTGDGLLEQIKCEPAMEVMDTSDGEYPVQNNSKSSDAPTQRSEASWPPSKAELLALIEDYNRDPINENASVDIVDHELEEVPQEIKKDQSNLKEEPTISSTSQGSSCPDTVDRGRSPKVARHGREKQKQTVQVVIYQPYARPGRSKGSSVTDSHQQKMPQHQISELSSTTSTTAQALRANSPQQTKTSDRAGRQSLVNSDQQPPKPPPNMKTPKRLEKPQQQNSPARSTRSKTHPTTLFVELNQVGNAIKAKDAKEEAEHQRYLEARDRRWYKKQKQEKENMQRARKEWFDEQDDEFQRQQAAKGEEVSGYRFYGGYTGSAR